MGPVVDRSEAVALFERRRDAWLAEDFEAYIGLFADDVVVHLPMGEPIHGRAAYADMVRRSYDHVRPVAFDFHAIAVHDGRVLAEWTITIEFRAGGEQVAYRGMSTCQLDDGRITWWREYYDPSRLRP